MFISAVPVSVASLMTSDPRRSKRSHGTTTSDATPPPKPGCPRGGGAVRLMRSPGSSDFDETVRHIPYRKQRN